METRPQHCTTVPPRVSEVEGTSQVAPCSQYWAKALVSCHVMCLQDTACVHAAVAHALLSPRASLASKRNLVLTAAGPSEKEYCDLSTTSILVRCKHPFFPDLRGQVVRTVCSWQRPQSREQRLRGARSFTTARVATLYTLTFVFKSTRPTVAEQHTFSGCKPSTCSNISSIEHLSIAMR